MEMQGDTFTPLMLLSFTHKYIPKFLRHIIGGSSLTTPPPVFHSSSHPQKKKKEEKERNILHISITSRHNERTRCRKACAVSQEENKIPQVQRSRAGVRKRAPSLRGNDEVKPTASLKRSGQARTDPLGASTTGTPILPPPGGR